MGRNSYLFGSKNNWRRTVWNEVLRRVGPRAENEVILYLPGPENLDYRVGTEKGVPSHNLIAVEESKETVSLSRRMGVNTIQGNLFDVISSWSSKKHPVCAVLADLCSGLEPQVIDLLDIVHRPGMMGCTTLLNLQRGRDSRSFYLRDHRQTHPQFFAEPVSILRKNFTTRHRSACMLQLLEGSKSNLSNLPLGGVDIKHRGVLYMSTVMYNMLYILSIILDDKAILQDEVAARINAIYHWLNPKFYTYRSSGSLYMDSVIYDDPYPPMLQSLQSLLDLDAALVEEISDELLRTNGSNKPCRRQVAAALAIRSQRMGKAKRRGKHA